MKSPIGNVARIELLDENGEPFYVRYEALDLEVPAREIAGPAGCTVYVFDLWHAGELQEALSRAA